MKQASTSIISKYGGSTTELFIHGPNEVIGQAMLSSSNFYEIEFLDYIRRTVGAQREIVDIGANIGNHSVFFAKFIDCTRVHSFEPFKLNVDLLMKNLLPFQHKCIVYPFALSDTCETKQLYNSQANNFGGFSLHSYSNGSSFPVSQTTSTVTLDSIGLTNISMMKIDVENHENEVLAGARETITRNKPIIFIENLHHGFPGVCPDSEPHKKIFDELNYVKAEANILGSFMDLWVPKS